MSSRAPSRPKKPAAGTAGRLSAWRSAAAGYVLGLNRWRLAAHVVLVAAAVATLTLLLNLSAGGLNRYGLKQLVDRSTVTPPKRPSGYIAR